MYDNNAGSILSIVGSLLGGGLIGVVLGWILNYRKDKRTGLQTIIDNFNADNQRLRDEVGELKKEFEAERKERFDKEIAMREEIGNLRNKLVVMESAHLDLPIPQWLKDTDGIMIALNSEYEKMFLTPMGKVSTDYIGHKDTAIWDDRTAEMFTRHDREVLRSGKPLQTQELIDLGEYTELWEVLKYPRYSGNILIGIGGIAFKKIETNTTPA